MPRRKRSMDSSEGSDDVGSIGKTEIPPLKRLRRDYALHNDPYYEGRIKELTKPSPYIAFNAPKGDGVDFVSLEDLQYVQIDPADAFDKDGVYFKGVPPKSIKERSAGTSKQAGDREYKRRIEELTKPGPYIAFNAPKGDGVDFVSSEDLQYVQIDPADAFDKDGVYFKGVPPKSIKERSKGAQIQDFNKCIDLIKSDIESINDSIVQKQYKIRFRVIIERYPAMLATAKARYPQLFEEKQEHHMFDVIEDAKKSKRGRYEITAHQAVVAVRNLARDLRTQLEADKRFIEELYSLQQLLGPNYDTGRFIYSNSETDTLGEVLLVTYPNPETGTFGYVLLDGKGKLDGDQDAIQKLLDYNFARTKDPRAGDRILYKIKDKYVFAGWVEEVDPTTKNVNVISYIVRDGGCIHKHIDRQSGIRKHYLDFLDGKPDNVEVEFYQGRDILQELEQIGGNITNIKEARIVCFAEWHNQQISHYYRARLIDAYATERTILVDEGLPSSHQEHLTLPDGRVVVRTGWENMEFTFEQAEMYIQIEDLEAQMVDAKERENNQTFSTLKQSHRDLTSKTIALNKKRHGELKKTVGQHIKNDPEGTVFLDVGGDHFDDEDLKEFLSQYPHIIYTPKHRLGKKELFGSDPLYDAEEHEIKLPIDAIVDAIIVRPPEAEINNMIYRTMGYPKGKSKVE